MVLKVVAKSHFANFFLFVGWVVNLFCPRFPSSKGVEDLSQQASLVFGRIPSAWGWLLLLGGRQLGLLLSVEHKGFLDA